MTTAFAQIDKKTRYEIQKLSYQVRVLQEKNKQAQQRIDYIDNQNRYQIDLLKKQTSILASKDTIYINQIIDRLEKYYNTQLQEVKEQLKKETAFTYDQIHGRKDLQNKINQISLKHETDKTMEYIIAGVIILINLIIFYVLYTAINSREQKIVEKVTQKQKADIQTLFNDYINGNLKRTVEKAIHSQMQASQINSPHPDIVQRMQQLEHQIVQINQSIAKLSDAPKEPTTIQTTESSVQQEANQAQDDLTLEDKSLLRSYFGNTVHELNKPQHEESVTDKQEPTVMDDPIHPPIPESTQEDIVQEEPAETSTQQDLLGVKSVQEAPLEDTSVQEEEPIREDPIEDLLVQNTTHEEVEEPSQELSLNYTAEQWLEKANQQYAEQQWEDAISSYTQTLSLESNNFMAHTKKANCHYILKELDQASIHYETAIRQNPDFVPAYNNLIEIYIHTHNFFQVISSVESLSRIEKSVRYKAIELFFKLIGQTALVQDTSLTESELDQILTYDFQLKYSFKEIEEWLKSADIDQDGKVRISDKIKIMKQKA